MISTLPIHRLNPSKKKIAKTPEAPESDLSPRLPEAPAKASSQPQSSAFEPHDLAADDLADDSGNFSDPSPSLDSLDETLDSIAGKFGALSFQNETLASISTWIGDRAIERHRPSQAESLVDETLQSFARWLGDDHLEPKTLEEGSPAEPPAEISEDAGITNNERVEPDLERGHGDRSERDRPQAMELELEDSESFGLGDGGSLRRLSFDAPDSEPSASNTSDLGASTLDQPRLRPQNDSRTDRPKNPRSINPPESREAIALSVLRVGFAPVLHAKPAAHSGTPTPSPASRSRSSMWVLGIDIGTSGISAVLFNQTTHRLYPLYWRAASAQADQPQPSASKPQPFTLAAVPPSSSSSDRWFRFPVRVLFDPHMNQSPPKTANRQEQEESPDAIPLTNLKPLLNLGIPHFSSHTGAWEPTVKWSPHQTLSLKAVQQAVQTLLATLIRSSLDAEAIVTTPSQLEFSEEDRTALVCGAVGIGDEQLQAALRNLSQVVLSTPSGWPDEYLFNLQDIMLRLDLVREEHQIRWVDEAIATILSELETADGLPIKMSPRLTPQQRTRQRQWQGMTLVLNGGSANTHLAIAHLPQQMSTLQPQHFTTQSVPYAGHALDQDIITQILYPIWVQAIALTTQEKAMIGTSRIEGNVPLASLSSEGWQSLSLKQLPLPIPGQEDLDNRHRFQQLLHGSAVGQQFIDLAQLLKVALQYREEVIIRVDRVPYRLSRKMLSDRVLMPYVQMLHRQVDTLIQRFTQRWNQCPEAKQQPITPIRHIVCSGGTASLRIVALWLRKRFPNATIVQDSYSPPSGLMTAIDTLRKADKAKHHLWQHQSRQLQTTPTCSRVAYGLPLLCLHPSLAEAKLRPYADYFLLSELLQIVSDQPLPLETIFATLAQRGIEIGSCRTQVLALLNGYLPPGLQSGGRYQTWLANPIRPTEASLGNMTLTGITLDLFEQLNAQTYRTIPEHRVVFQRYLSTLFAAPTPRSQVRSPSFLE